MIKKTIIGMWIICSSFSANSMETKPETNFIITQPYNPHKPQRQQLVDGIMLEPATVLKNSYAINEQFLQEIKQRDLEKQPVLEVYKAIKEVRAKYEQQSPIFSLLECIQEGEALCPMSREARPTHRAQFEQKVVQAMVEEFKKNKKLHFAVFGCGKLFPELVILTNVLAQNPQAQLDVHCIDKNYVPYCEAMKLFSKHKAPVINLSDPIEPKYIDKPLIELIKKHPDFKNDAVLTSQPFFEELFIQEMRFQQVVDFVDKTFPKAHVRIFPHSSAAKCVAYLNKITPDIITAIDIDDVESKARGSMRDYLLLCAEVLKKNPAMHNYLLARIDNDPCLTVSLAKGPNAMLVPLKNDQEQPVEVYLNPVNILN
jgi:hypothetical protein